MSKTYDEKKVLELLEDGYRDSAYEFLTSAIPSVERKLDKAVKNLASLLKEVQKTFPDATFYTNSGGLNLLLGNPHDENGNPQRELEALTFNHIISIGDGGY